MNEASFPGALAMYHHVHVYVAVYIPICPSLPRQSQGLATLTQHTCSLLLP